MSGQLSPQKQIETLKQKLTASKSAHLSLENDFKTQSSLLISFITQLSKTCKGIDILLDNKLAKLRQTFAKSAPISQVEAQIVEITLMLNKYSLTNDKIIHEVHEKLHRAGSCLQKQSGIPSEIRRSLRTLLLEAELKKEALVQYTPYLTKLLSFYESISTNRKAVTETTLITKETDNVSQVNKVLIQRFTQILNNLSLSETYAEKMNHIKSKLNQSMTNDSLLDTFLTAFDVIIEDLQEEKNTAKDFLFTLSETLSKVQNTVKSTLSTSQDACNQHDVINKQLQQHVKAMSTSVGKASSLSAVKIEINNQLDLIVNSLEEKSQLEVSQQQKLQSQLEDMTSKVEKLEKESRQFEKRIQEQKAKSLTDSLTKLGNRAAFDEHFTKEIVKFYHSPFSLTLAVLDLDDFKRINDSYGHTAGDKTLQVIANTLKKHLSKDAFIGRYGGEEFVLVFSSLNKSGVVKKLEYIKQKISRLPFKFKNTNVSITTSIGVTAVKTDDNIHTAFERADEALYQAKDKGKNTVITL